MKYYTVFHITICHCISTVTNVLNLSVSGDKLVRATELVKLLSLEKSYRGAIKLVTALKLPNLAERFSNILEVSLFTAKCICLFLKIVCNNFSCITGKVAT